mgnify:CR=1 FL=1
MSRGLGDVYKRQLSTETRNSSGQISEALSRLDEISGKMTSSIEETLRLIQLTLEKVMQTGENVEKITKENWMDFDVVVASPDMMGVVGRLGKILGPRGLMPNPKAGTVTPDVAKAVTDAKAGKIEYRLDKTNIIHCPIGKASFGAEKLEENFNTLMDAVVKAKPAAAKGQYLKSVVVASTMGVGIKINTSKYGS